MKHILSLTGLLLALSAPVFAQTQVAPAPPLMNFQGRLAKPDGTPLPDGSYTVIFSLWNAATGGTQGWTETDTVTTRNGAVAVLLGKTTALTDGLFAGPIYLQIQIGAAAPLAPRQQIVTVAHAFQADTVPDGSIGTTQIASGAITGAQLAPGLLNGLSWNLGGNSGTNPAANFLGTTDNQALILKSNGQRVLSLAYASSSSGSPFFFTTTGVNTLGGYSGNTMASGVVGGTIAGGGYIFGRLGSYSSSVNSVTGSFGFIGGGAGNTAGSYASVAGGYSNIAAGQYSFAAGQQAQANHQGAFVWNDSTNAVFASSANDQFLIHASGNVGINTSAPQQVLSVSGGLAVDQGNLNAGGINNGLATGYGLTFGSSAGEGIASNRVTANLNQYGLDFYTDFANRMSITQGGFVGIGTTAPASPLDVNGTTAIRGDLRMIQRGGGIGNNGGDGRALVDAGNNSSGISPSGLHINFGNDFGQVTIDSAATVQGALTVNGGATAHFVNIVGGSDVAEPYFVAASGDIKPLPGYVVAIDAAQIGQMRVVGKAYDKTVSGIISGANGIKPGITLRQEGTVADGTFPVASIGRVWCWCDADANGAIEAGDMLTTSDTPGHAMRVTDYNRANGSIIGKAMSPLKSGKGLVLVLVSLK